jgi:hypothetical protein
VEYLDAHSVFSEWVYNGADIDGQDVIWARSMGAKADAVLKDYYPDRLAWRVEVGEGATLHPYPDVP